MTAVLLVGTGGFLGSILRYLLGGWIHRLVDNSWFPYGTLAVNAAGCLLIGFLGGLAENRQVFGPQARLLLFIGLLGGFTTFSTFAYETMSLIRGDQVSTAMANIALQLVLGLAGVWVGGLLSRLP